jgi:hypothetical protein
MSTTSKRLKKNFHISSIVKQQRSKRERFVSNLSPLQAEILIHDWSRYARLEQLPPQSEWAQWLFLAGRGAGKTRSGAEWVREMVRRGRKSIALVGPTAAVSCSVVSSVLCMVLSFRRVRLSSMSICIERNINVGWWGLSEAHLAPSP